MGLSRTEKHLRNEPEDVGKTSTLCLRLTGEERALLQQKADNLGCTISQISRQILLQNDADFLSTKEENERKHRLLLSAKAVKNAFKNYAEDIRQVLDDVRNHIKYDDLSGLQRDVRSANDITVELQKTVNEYVRLLAPAEPEVHIVARSSGESPAAQLSEAVESVRRQVDELNLETLKFFNMEKAIVVGTVSDSPKKFTTKAGFEMFSFHVVATKNRGGKAKDTVYEVVSKSDDELFSLVAKDKRVTVVGDLDIYRGETEGRTFVNIKISDPTVTFGDAD